MDSKNRPDFEVRIKYVPLLAGSEFRRIRAVLGAFTAICLDLPDQLRYDQSLDEPQAKDLQEADRAHDFVYAKQSLPSFRQIQFDLRSRLPIHDRRGRIGV